MIIQAPNGATPTMIKLRNVLYAPGIGCTLISISQIDQAGYSVAFQDGKCIVRNLKNRVHWGQRGTYPGDTLRIH